MLQQDLQAHEDEDDAAHQLGAAFVPGAEKAAHLHPHSGEQEGNDADEAGGHGDIHA